MKKVIFLLVTIFLLLNFNSSYANYIEENSIREQYIIMEEDYADLLKSLSGNKSSSGDFDSGNFEVVLGKDHWGYDNDKIARIYNC